MQKTDKQNLFDLMGKIFHNTRQHLDAEFKRVGLSRPAWLVLAMLRLNPDHLTQAHAKNYVGVENSYFTKILNQLEANGYIIREIDPENRRQRLIKANPKAGKKLQRAFQLIHDITEAVQVDLTDKQISTLYKALSQIQSRAKAYTSRS